ncbi:MAG: carboxypeptidase-like regulatory domain-containing protein, partial [Chitinophaga rupis]
MKLTTALLLIGCLHTAATGLSQESKVTLDLRDVSIPRLFKAIEKKTAYRFVYSNDILPPTFLVSVTVNETPVTSVLRTALVNTGLIFNMVDDEVIVVSKALPPGKASITVTGTVTDESGNPLSGVSVYLKGAQSVGTVTNDKGLFKLEITESTATLVFSSVGMETKEVPLNGKTALNVFLRKTISQQQEIVVIGYGTQRKGDLTSAVATVKADNFVKGSVIDAGQLLQGKVAGLAVSTPSGDPTSGTQILLRGRTTLLGANLNPLILIDGVPGDLKTVAPQDIESIDILKDGSAAAIYGTRGTNGVILITTRRASANYKSTVEYSTYASTQTVARKLDISTAADYRAQVNAGYRDKSWDLGSSTDWIKEISRTPFSHQHNLTIRGGNSKTNYLLNANYNQAEGIFKKSDNQTFTARADINHSMFDDKVKINASILNSSNKYTTT